MAKHGYRGEDGEEDGEQVEADCQLESHKMSHPRFHLLYIRLFPSILNFLLSQRNATSKIFSITNVRVPFHPFSWVELFSAFVCLGRLETGGKLVQPPNSGFGRQEISAANQTWIHLIENKDHQIWTSIFQQHVQGCLISYFLIIVWYEKGQDFFRRWFFSVSMECCPVSEG